MTWLLTLLVPALIALVWHGFSLKVAVALAGEESPGFLRTAWVSWIGGLFGWGAAVLWTYTLGMAVWLFSSWLSMGLGLLIQLVTTAIVYRGGLRLSTPASLGVTGIHMVLSVLVNGLLGWFVYSTLL